MSTWQLLSSFPTAVPTVVLAILLIYWLLSIIGLVDLGDNLELELGHHDLHAGHHDTDVHALAGYLVAMGLGGVPLSIAVTALAFFTWLFTALLHEYLLVWVPTVLLQVLLGTGILLLAAALSIPVSAQLIKPLRGLFVKHQARSNSSLVGLNCRIVTQSVDEKFGRAEVRDSGASLNIRVWAQTPNALTRNSDAVILAYDEARQQYEVQAAAEKL